LGAIELVLAQQPAQPDPTQSASPQEATEALTAWEWFQEVQLPERGSARYVDFLVTPSVFSKSRADLADLRLRDANDRDVPYALRVRREEREQRPLEARKFNESTKDDRSVELSLDLGEMATEHNEVELQTNGTNFRRRVQIEGSDTSKDWNAILEKAYVVHFEVERRTVESRRLQYPVSRHRYLRIRLYPDAGLEDDRPVITSATVFRTARRAGEYVTRPAELGERQAVRTDDGPGSAWDISFAGELVPSERLSFDVADDDFARSYRLDLMDSDGRPQVLKQGVWQRRAGEEHKPLEIEYTEIAARQLRLSVTDHRNQPLNITAVRYASPARQVVFAHTESLAAPVRLYFGNPKAEPPHYDFAANLPVEPAPPPVRANLAEVEKNPVYEPAPKPLAERWPWLVYAVLGLASLTLLGVLGLLSYGALARHRPRGKA
jgi:hypothetical protein